MPRTVIFANGELPDLEKARMLLQSDDYLIAADGGAKHLINMDVFPSLVVGDLDSIDEEMLFTLTSVDVKIERYSEDKNETDFELALHYAIEMQPSAILIVGALGGRLDQTLANLSLLTDPSLSNIDIRLDDGIEEVFFYRASSSSKREVRGRSGDIVSMIPWQAPVEGVTTTGLRWPLRAETLYPDKSRGISNMMLAELASVSIQSGLLLIVHRRSIEN